MKIENLFVLNRTKFVLYITQFGQNMTRLDNIYGWTFFKYYWFYTKYDWIWPKCYWICPKYEGIFFKFNMTVFVLHISWLVIIMTWFDLITTWFVLNMTELVQNINEFVKFNFTSLATICSAPNKKNLCSIPSGSKSIPSQEMHYWGYPLYMAGQYCYMLYMLYIKAGKKTDSADLGVAGNETSDIWLLQLRHCCARDVLQTPL